MNEAHADAELARLIDRVARHDAHALRALYERCAPRLFGLALRVLSDRHLAEDVLQEAFLQIWRSAASYRASLSPPMAWMGLIVRSRALDLLRRRRSDHADDGPPDEDGPQEPASPAEDPLAMADLSQQASALHQCLSRLEGPQREVLSLAYLRELSHGELAAQLGLPLGTVKTWIRRGLEHLRGCMARFAGGI